MNDDEMFSDVIDRLGIEAGESDFTHELLFVKDEGGDFGPSKQYKVKNENLSQMMKDYCFVLNDRRDLDMALAERTTEQMPVIIQLHMKFDERDFVEPYDEGFIQTFIRLLQGSIRKHLIIPSNDCLTCCMLETVPYDDPERKYTYMDVRFQFPNCRCDVEVQVKSIIPTLMRELRRANVKKNFIMEPFGEWDAIIDHSVYTRSVAMLGSRIHWYGAPLFLHDTYGMIQDDDDEEYEIDPIVSLNDTFNLESHGYINSGIMSRSAFTGKNDYNYWLPFLLSINYGHTLIMSKCRSGRSPISTKLTNKRYSLANFGKNGDIDEIDKMEMAVAFLGMWKPSTLLKYSNWCDAGEALFDADDAGEQGLKTWIEFSIKALDAEKEADVPFLEHGVELSCSDMYSQFQVDRITVRTLAEVAKEDDKNGYEAWHHTWCRPAMEVAAKSGLDSDLARAFFRCYWLEAICCYNGKRVTWYVFDKHRLRENPNGWLLRSRLSGDFYKKFLSLLAEITDTMMRRTGSDGDKDQKRGRELITSIGKVLERLKTGPCKSRIMNEVVECYVQDNLEMLLDENPEILGLPNGVLVATRNSILARPGRIEDYVSRNTKVSLNIKLHWDHADVKAVMKWIKQTFPDDELAMQWRKILASLLRGGNLDKKFNVLTGEGDNSKSAWVRALEQVLGPYCIKFPVSMITGGGGDANGPSPALARSKSTRLCVLEEPDEGTPIKGNIIKYLTGSDTFFARFLKKNGGDIRPMFKLFLMCNKIPAIPGGGKAVRNRMAIMPCLSTWCDDAPSDEDEQMEKRRFPLDTNFDDYIPKYAPALLWIMYQDYALYVKEGVRKEPKIVREYTEKYWEEVDIWHQFIADNIIFVKDEDGELNMESRIEVGPMHTRFKSWMRDAYPNLGPRKVPDRPTLRSEMSRRLGSHVDGSWGGVTLRGNPVGSGGIQD